MTSTISRRLSALAALSLAASLAAGCSGGGATGAPVAPRAAAIAPSTSTHTQQARLTVKIPVRTSANAAAGRRAPRYVSASTTELSVRTGFFTTAGLGASPWQVFDVSNSAALSMCSTPAGGYRTCVLTVTAPVPTQAGTLEEFQVVATDSTSSATDAYPQGNYLSAGSAVQPVNGATPVQVYVTLSAFIASLAACSSAQTVPCAVPTANGGPSFSVWAAPGSQADVPVALTAYDFNGAVITDAAPQTFHNPLTFCDTLGGMSAGAACTGTGPLTSPFTYAAGLESTANGLIPAQIAYTAPATGGSLHATVTAGAPNSWNATLVPPVTFDITTLVVSDATNTPTASIANVSASGAGGAPTDATLTIDEIGATSFTVSATGSNAIALLAAPGGAPLPAMVPAANGSATFDVHALAPTTTAAPASVTITDANGTQAIVSVTVGS